MAFRAVNAAGVPTGCCYSHASKSMLFNRHAGGAFEPTDQMPISPYELICVKGDKADAAEPAADADACDCHWATKWPKACSPSSDDGSRCWGVCCGASAPKSTEASSRVEKKVLRRELPSKQPHLFFHLLDDVGWYDVGFNAERTAKPSADVLSATSNITALAREGVVLERHYAFFVCSPSRRALLSGRLPIHHSENLSPTRGDDLDLRWTTIGQAPAYRPNPNPHPSPSPNTSPNPNPNPSPNPSPN